MKETLFVFLLTGWIIVTIGLIIAMIPPGASELTKISYNKKISVAVFWPILFPLMGVIGAIEFFEDWRTDVWLKRKEKEARLEAKVDAIYESEFDRIKEEIDKDSDIWLDT